MSKRETNLSAVDPTIFARVFQRLGQRLLGAVTIGAMLTTPSCQQSQPAAAPLGAGQPVPNEPAPNPVVEDPEARYRTAPPEERVKPPEPAPTPDFSFPKIEHLELANGLGVQVIERHTLPIIELRMVVLSGTATDGDKPGLAVLAGEILKTGGAGKYTGQQLLDRVESLGSRLSVVTAKDETTISMSVTSEHLDDALEILATVAQKPRFDPTEYRKLKRREMDRVLGQARSDAGWAASMVLYRELYDLPKGNHPYSSYDATSKQVEQVMLYECQAWHRTHFTPKNAFLVIAGDVSPEQSKQATEQAFGTWRGTAPNPPKFSNPIPITGLELFLVDRPDSPQAEIQVAVLGSARNSSEWPALRVTNQILGGGVSGRLFLDIREQRSLAYRTYSSMRSVANGPVPIVLSAGTQTAKAGLALQGLLEHLERIGNEAPTEAETQIATRYLSDIFLLKMETVGAVAGMAVDLTVHGLPDTYYDEYREQVRATQPESVAQVAARYFKRDQAIVVVAGDAKRLAAPLSHFGKVHVVNPDKEFATEKLVPYDPTQAIELERIDGT